MKTHPWKQVLSSLAERPVLAKWHLSSGVSFFMYTPSIERLRPNEIDGTTVQYEELTELLVPAQHELGNLKATNDLATTRKKMEDFSEVEMRCTASEIRIQLKGSAK